MEQRILFGYFSTLQGLDTFLSVANKTNYTVSGVALDVWQSNGTALLTGYGLSSIAGKGVSTNMFSLIPGIGSGKDGSFAIRWQGDASDLDIRAYARETQRGGMAEIPPTRILPVPMGRSEFGHLPEVHNVGRDASINPWGNLHISRSLFRIDGAMPIYVVASYNSNDNRVGELGLGWTHAYDEQITLGDANDFAVYRRSDGHRIILKKVSASGTVTTYESAPRFGAHLTLVRDTSKTTDRYVLEDKVKSRREFDEGGFLRRVVHPGGDGMYDIIINRTSGQITSITRNGRSITFTYSSGKVSSITYNSKSYQFTYTGDKLTRITYPDNKYWEYGYDGSNLLNSLKDAKAQEWQFEHTGKRCTLATDPASNEIVFRYWRGGYEITDREGKKWKVHADDIREAATIVQEPVEGSFSMARWDYWRNNTRTKVARNVTGDPDITRKEFDDHGNLLRQYNPAGYKTEYTFTTGTWPNQLYQLKNDDGDVLITNTYDNNGRLWKSMNYYNEETEYGYNSDGTKAWVDGPKDQRTRFLSYNSDGLHTVRRDALGNDTTFTYDSYGRVLTITDGRPVGERGTTTFEYDPNRGWLEKTTFPDDNYIEWGYDDNGDIISRRNAKGETTTYTINNRYWTTLIDYPNDDDVTFGYDDEGRRISMTDGLGDVAITYHDNGRIYTKEVHDGLTTRYSFDPSGNRTSLEDTTDSLTWDYVFNNRSLMISMTAPSDKITYYTYDKYSRCTRIDKADGAYSIMAYDKMWRTTKITNWNSGGATKLSEFDMTASGSRDANGNILKIVRENGETREYTYDVLNQLLTETWKNSGGSTLRNWTFTYDEAGNRETAAVFDGSSTTNYTYSYNVNSQLTSVTDGTTTWTYSYDDNGNVTSIVPSPSGDRYDFTYNDNDLVTEIKKNNTTIAWYTYCGLDKRVAIDDADGDRKLYYDEGTNLVVERDTSDEVTAHYAHGHTLIAGNGSIHYVRRGNSDQIFHFDQVGSIHNISRSGASMQTYDYSAFGELISSSGSDTNPFQFQSNWTQIPSAGELVLTPARTYEPQVGRFLQRDVEDLIASNLYAGLENNPISVVDPSGMQNLCNGAPGSVESCPTYTPFCKASISGDCMYRGQGQCACSDIKKHRDPRDPSVTYAKCDDFS